MPRSSLRYLLFLLVAGCLSVGVMNAQPSRRVAGDQTITSALIIRSAPGFLETIAARDPIEAAMVTGTWHPPQPGDRLQYNDTLEGRWEWTTVDSAGWFQHEWLEKGAYVYVPVQSDREETILMDAMGNSMVYVNGAPRTGNPYQYKDTREDWEPRFDYAQLPVRLHKGTNEFLFQCNRGILKIKLHHLVKDVFFNTADMTLPDCVTARAVDDSAAVLIVNATDAPVRGWTIVTSYPGGNTTSSAVPLIQPMTLRKVGFRIAGPSPSTVGSINARLSLFREAGGAAADTATVVFRIVTSGENRKETYRSKVDGSLQYYSILPPKPAGEEHPALIFSLHGAGVEAINQTGSYFPKTWATVVAPTNRRPYGYNWEDWGRTDAIDVLDIVTRRLNVDENRIYLTGHSMGGHGVYHVGSLFPDRFAAIGPSAGWISFWTYRVREGFKDPSPMRRMLQRATLPSETYTMARNYGQLGVYILHGSDDDNVRVDQSRKMAAHLQTFDHDFVYHEQQGVGHWWDISDEPGADCVDWPPMLDYFARHARPEMNRIRRIDFAVANPGISSHDYWATVEAQTRELQLSEIHLQLDPGLRRIGGTTENVARLSLDLSPLSPGAPFTVVLDSQSVGSIPWPNEGTRVWFEKKGSVWSVTAQPPASVKGPRRYGTFKDIINNRVMFVFGTKGTAEENRWAREKARFDAERFWYQGNGTVDVLADSEFSPSVHPDRNILLYGNASTNGAWGLLLKGSPVQVETGRVVIGDHSFAGNDLSCLFIRPREGSDVACVGAVSGTGIIGMRLNTKLAYLMPGVGFPDCLVMSAAVLTQGEEGVRAAGFFGLDWSVPTGEFVWGK